MSKNWSAEEIKELIEIYETKQILWNVSHTEYRDRIRKQKVFEEIAVKFSCSAGEVQRKLHNLRNQVRKSLLTIIKNKLLY